MSHSTEANLPELGERNQTLKAYKLFLERENEAVRELYETLTLGPFGGPEDFSEIPVSELRRRNRYLEKEIAAVRSENIGIRRDVEKLLAKKAREYNQSQNTSAQQPREEPMHEEERAMS